MKTIFIALFSLIASTAFSQPVQRVKITDLEKIMADTRTPLIINFWATWCKPCIEEIPHFQEIAQKHTKDSVKLLLVSLDSDDFYPEKIAAFVKKRKITAPVLWLDETNADYFCPRVDPKWSGAIPASLFLHQAKGYRAFFEQPLSAEQLEKEIKAML